MKFLKFFEIFEISEIFEIFDISDIFLIFLKSMNYLNSLAPTSTILSNDIKTISKLVEGEGNICTNKILGSLEILAIKN